MAVTPAAGWQRGCGARHAACCCCILACCSVAVLCAPLRVSTAPALGRCPAGPVEHTPVVSWLLTLAGAQRSVGQHAAAAAALQKALGYMALPPTQPDGGGGSAGGAAGGGAGGDDEAARLHRKMAAQVDLVGVLCLGASVRLCMSGGRITWHASGAGSPTHALARSLSASLCHRLPRRVRCLTSLLTPSWRLATCLARAPPCAAQLRRARCCLGGEARASRPAACPAYVPPRSRACMRSMRTHSVCARVTLSGLLPASPAAHRDPTATWPWPSR